jgi:molybdate transport system substrate-binding protein
MRSRLAAVVALRVSLAGLLAGCGGSSASTSHGATSHGAGAKPVVFAASSLTDAFTAVGASYGSSTGGAVAFSFAGSQQLVAQIQNGAPADVLATADTTTMAKVAAKLAAPAKPFASNRLVIVVRHGNPKHVATLRDLGRPSLSVVLAAPSVPAGSYAARVLATARVSVHARSLEDNVRGVLTKVELGEADAGIVYATDVRSAKGRLDAVVIPHAPTPVYEIGALTDRGKRFVEFVLSAQGQSVLRGFGFLPPP